MIVTSWVQDRFENQREKFRIESAKVAGRELVNAFAGALALASQRFGEDPIYRPAALEGHLRSEGVYSSIDKAGLAREFERWLARFSTSPAIARSELRKCLGGQKNKAIAWLSMQGCCMVAAGLGVLDRDHRQQLAVLCAEAGFGSSEFGI